MQDLTRSIQEQLNNFDSDSEIYSSLNARFQYYTDSDIVARQALLHFTVERLEDPFSLSQPPHIKWLTEMALLIEYARYLSIKTHSVDPNSSSLVQQQFIIKTWWKDLNCSVFLNLQYSNTAYDFRQLNLKLDEEDIQDTQTLKTAVIRRILAKFILDQQLYEELGVLLIDDEFFRELGLKCLRKQNFKTHGSKLQDSIVEDVVRDNLGQKNTLASLENYINRMIASSGAKTNHIDTFMALLLPKVLPSLIADTTPLQHKIIDTMKASALQESEWDKKRYLDAASEFVAGTLLEVEPEFLGQVDRLVIVEKLPNTKSSQPMFHVVIQDSLIETLQRYLQKTYSKYKYQTYTQPPVELDDYARLSVDDIMSFLLMCRADQYQQSASSSGSVIQAINAAEDISAARLVMTDAIRALILSPNATFYQVVESKIQQTLDMHPHMNPSTTQQIEQKVQHLIRLLNDACEHEQKRSLIQNCKKELDYAFIVDARMQILRALRSVLLMSLLITAATLVLGLTMPWWTLSGFMLAVIHPFVYIPAAITISTIVAWKAQSIFKQNKEICEKVQRPLWKLEECETAMCRP